MLRVALGNIDNFVQRQDWQSDIGGAGAVGIGLVESATGIQGFQLCQGEGAGRAVFALGEFLRNIRGA